MSNTKHTSGPWFYEGAERGSKYVVRYKAPHYTDVARGELIADRIERVDDARLIAAAPELLEVLTDLMTMRNKCFIPNDGDWWDRKARTAVAKARA